MSTDTKYLNPTILYKPGNSTSNNSPHLHVTDRFNTGRPNSETRPILSTEDTQTSPESSDNILYTTAAQPKDMCETSYANSSRFRPPPTKFSQFAGFGLRFLIAEFLAVLFFCIVAYLVQANLNSVYGKFTLAPTMPTTTDLFYASVTKGSVAFMCTYLFWNWGKPLFNPALTFGYWWMGHLTFLDMVFRWVIQFVASLLAIIISIGFSCAGTSVGSCTDPSVGVGLVNLASHSASFHALWEILGSIILALAAIWAYSTDRLYREGATMALAKLTLTAREGKEGMEKDNPAPHILLTGEGSRANNATALGTFVIPAEYQQVGGGPIVSFQVSVVIGVAYTILSYVGYLVTGGDGSLNFLLWWPRVINLSGSNGELAITLLEQGFLYFFCPFVGVIIIGGISWFLIYLTRRCAFTLMDETSKADPEDNPHAY